MELWNDSGGGTGEKKINPATPNLELTLPHSRSRLLRPPWNDRGGDSGEGDSRNRLVV